MTITPVSAFAPSISGAAGSKNSGGFTPLPGELLVIAATARDNVAAVTPLLTLSHTFGGTWSFTKETNDLPLQFVSHSIWFAIVPPGAGTGQVTVTADRTSARWRMIGLRFNGNNGESPPVNRRSNFTTAAAAPSTTVPNALVGPSSCLCGVIFSQGNVAPSINPGAGFTELLEAGDAAATIEQVEYNSAPTSTTVDWSGCGTTGSRPFVFEVKAAATITATLTVQRTVTRLSPLSDPVQLFAPFSAGTVASNTTPAFTPTAGDLVLIGVSARQNTGADPVPDFSISNTHAGTWSWTRYQATNSPVAAVGTVVAVFAAIVPPSPGSGTVTVSTSTAVIRWSVMGDAISGGAMVPWNWNHIDTLTGGLAFDLPRIPKLTSLQVGYLWVNVQNPVVTPGTGWTEVRETGPIATATLEMQFRRSNASPTISWADVGTAGSGVAIGIEVPLFAAQLLTQNAYTDTVTSHTTPSITPHPGRWHFVSVTCRDSGSATTPTLDISTTFKGTWTWQSATTTSAAQHREQLFYAQAPADSGAPGTITVSITNGVTGSRWRIITGVIEDDVDVPVNKFSDQVSLAAASISLNTAPRPESWVLSACSAGGDTDGITCTDTQVGQVGGAVQATVLAVQARTNSASPTVTFTGCLASSNANGISIIEFPPLVVSKTLDIRRAVTTTVAKTLTLQRAVTAGLNPVSQTLDIRRAVTTSVSQTLTVQRAVQVVVTKTLTVARPISTYMTSTVTMRRAVNVIVSKTLTVQRVVNVVVAKTLDTRRSVNIVVAKTLTVQRGVTGPVARTLTLQRAVTTSVSKTLTVQRSTTVFVAKTLTVQRAVNLVVAKTVTVQRAVNTLVAKTLTTQRAVTGRVGSNLTVQRAVAARITRTLDIRRFTGSLTPAVPLIAFGIAPGGGVAIATSPSFSVQVGDLVIIDVAARQNTGTDQIPNFAITGNTFGGTWTWTRIQQTGLGTPSEVMARFMAVAPVGSDAAPGTITISAQITAGLLPIRWLEGGAIWRGGAQTVPNNNASGTDTTATPIATLATAPAANSASFAAVWSNIQGPVLTPGSGQNQLQELHFASSTASLQQEYHCGSPAQTASWSGAGTNSIWIVSEIPGAATTVVSKTLDTRRSIINTVTRTLTVSRSIQQTINRTLTVSRAVNKVVNKTLTVQRAVTTGVSKTLTLVRIVYLPLQLTLTLFRAVTKTVSRPLTLQRVVNKSISRTLDIRHSIINLVIRTLTLQHGIINTIVRTVDIRRSMQATVVKTLTVQRIVTARLTRTLTVQRVVLTLSGINSSLTLRRSLTVFISRPLTISRAINVVTSRTLDLRRAITITVARTLDLRRALSVFIARTLTVTRSVGTRLTANLTVARAVVSTISKQVSIRRAIIAPTSSTLTLRRNVSVFVAKQLTLRRAVTITVTNQALIIRQINVVMSSTLTLRRQVTVFMSSSVTIWRYVVGQVTRTLTIQRQVTRAMTSTLDIRRAIIARTQSTLTISRATSIFVARTLNLRRSITVVISKTVTLQRAVTTAAIRNLTISRSTVGPLANRLTIQRGVSVFVSRTLDIRRSITLTAKRTLDIRRAIYLPAIGRLTIQRSVTGRVARNFGLVRDIAVVTKSTLTMLRSVTLKALRNLTLMRSNGQRVTRTLTLRRTELKEVFGHVTIKRTVGAIVVKNLTIRRTIGSVASGGGIRIDHVFTGELIIRPLHGNVKWKVLGDGITVPHAVKAKVGP